MESRSFIALNEIVAVDITCNNPTCHARSTIPIGTGPFIYEQCPQCGAQWIGSDRESVNARGALGQLFRGLIDVLRLSGALNCKLQLEIRTASHGESR